MAESKTASKRRKKSHAIELSAKAAFFWGLCLFFLLAWIFVLGIFVGRGFVPDGVQSISELKSQITKLQKMLGHGDSTELDSVKKPFEDPKLAFYENLSSKKKEVARKSLSNKRGKKQKKSTLQEGKLAKKSTNKSKAVLRTEGKFTIQLASLGVQEKASHLVKKLAAKGYPAYYYEVKVKGVRRYRVRCGRFETTEQAKRFAQKLLRAEKIKGFVLRMKK